MKSDFTIQQISEDFCESVSKTIMSDKPIYVTEPSLPPLDEFTELLADIWERKWITNNGYYHKLFEASLARYLEVKHVSLFCNGMTALQVGLQALEITGEVITTPFSFPATTHAIHWNHCTPVFCDINAQTCNLDPARVTALITPKTTCILPVHVYGNPCDINGIQEIAAKHGLKVFYDAAHAFGVRLKPDFTPAANETGPGNLLKTDGKNTCGTTKTSQSVLNFGDLSMLSFHATKVFNTIEGGALITNDEKMKQRIDNLKNFGFAGETSVLAPGTNGKMNELQAAYGLLQLKYIDAQISRCHEITDLYQQALSDIPGIRFQSDARGVIHNYSYFPIFIEELDYGMQRDALYSRLKDHGIFARRYFYPLISNFPIYRNLKSAAHHNLPAANRIAGQVLCLPIHPELKNSDQQKIIEIIRSCSRSKHEDFYG